MAPKTCGHRDSRGVHDCTEPRWKDGVTFCRLHEDEYRAAKRAQRHSGVAVARGRKNVAFTAGTVNLTSTEDGELASDDDAAGAHEYIPMPELMELWNSMVIGASKRPAGNLMFLGPSGSGKTDGARYLAALAGLPFTKVDAASMTDPEAWFGTREIIVQEGVAVTDYRPSDFVRSIQRPGITLVDEVTRVRDEHRNVLIPLIDHTRTVMNPLTGEVVRRHPQNFIIMAGNVGLEFTGTNAVDPAFRSRSVTVEFDYIDPTSEEKIVADASGCSLDDAYVLVRFASETRQKHRMDGDFPAVDTRQLIAAAQRIADGTTRDLAVKVVVLNNASSEGGAQSTRTELQAIWNGVRHAVRPGAEPKPATPASDSGRWTCAAHPEETAKLIPAGISANGKRYPSFYACSVAGCSRTSDHPEGKSPSGVQAWGPSGANGAVCGSCGRINPAGRNTICIACGATI